MKYKKGSIWEEIEKGFGSGSKFRVLLHLVLNSKKAYTKYALVKATGIRTPSVHNQLNILYDLDWIKEYNFTPKTYQINLDNKVVINIIDFFQKLKYLYEN